MQKIEKSVVSDGPVKNMTSSQANVLLQDGFTADIQFGLVGGMGIEISLGEETIVARNMFRHFCCADRQLVIHVLMLFSIGGEHFPGLMTISSQGSCVLGVVEAPLA